MTADSAEHDLNLLAAFAEGRLDADARAQCFEHLAVCATCREIVARLTREVTAEPAARPASLQRYAWLAVAAVAVIGVGLAYRMRTSGTLPSSAPAETVSAGGSAGNSPTVGRSGAAPVASAPTESAQPGAAAAAPAKTGGRHAEGLSTRRSAERTVAGKIFRLVAGEWIDSALEPTSTLPVVDIKTAEAKADWLGRLPALRPYAALGNRVSVVIDGVVYRFDLPASL